MQALTASPIVERFMRFVSVSDTGCWYFNGTRHSQGYGMFGLAGKMVAATHFVLIHICNRARPAGLFACHSCDNPPCVNPKHLRWATHAENMQEMKEKGRRRIKVPVYDPEAEERKRRYARVNTSRGDSHWTRQMPEKVRRGELNGNAKYSDSEIARVRLLWQEGLPKARIARLTGISRSYVQFLVADKFRKEAII